MNKEQMVHSQQYVRRIQTFARLPIETDVELDVLYSSQPEQVCGSGLSVYVVANCNKSGFNIFWLVGWFGFNGPLRQYLSLYRAASQREGDRGEKG